MFNYSPLKNLFPQIKQQQSHCILLVVDIDVGATGLYSSDIGTS